MKPRSHSLSAFELLGPFETLHHSTLTRVVVCVARGLDEKMAYHDGWVGPAVAVLFVFLTYRLIVYPSLFSPLARIPSAHWSAPISRVWILWVRFVQRENRTLHSAHRRLGPVVRVSPNELSVSDVDSVRTIYQGGFEKPVWYSVFDNYGYGGGPDKTCVYKGLCSRVMSKASPACSRPVLRQSTRHGSG